MLHSPLWFICYENMPKMMARSDWSRMKRSEETMDNTNSPLFMPSQYLQVSCNCWWKISELGFYCVVAMSCPALGNPRDSSTPAFPVPSPFPGICSNSSIESVMPSNHLILCLPLLPSVFPSIRVFPNQSVLCIRWPKYWRFCISPSRLFRVDLL